jgi:cation:H+ antiporter
LAFETIIAVIALIFGIALLTLSSDKAIEHLIKIASEWKVSPLMIGLVLASIGTDLPEIINSIESSLLGHGNINVGDSLGSALAQMSLVLGLLPFLARGFKVTRKKVLVIGACEVLALMFAVSIAEKGYISQINALFLVASWIIFMLLTRSLMARKVKEKEQVTASTDERHLRHFVIAGLGFIGVAVGAFIVIWSVITLSTAFHIPEYLISFFVLAIGTSLPELVVDVMALRRKQYELAIGDIIGSSIVDASLSIGIGPLFFPIIVDGKLAMVTGLYAIFVSIVIISLLALREKVDRKIGALFIALYLFSYATLSVT